MAAPFRFDRTWRFPVPPEELWAVLNRTDEYVTWWSWLREFDADGIRPGTTARCTIQAPLPYALHCTIRVDEVTAARVVQTTVAGDLCGRARLEVDRAEGGSTARLVWSLDLGNPVLAQLARFGRPLMSWGHDLVVATGVEQFRHAALGIDAGGASLAS